MSVRSTIPSSLKPKLLSISEATAITSWPKVALGRHCMSPPLLRHQCSTAPALATQSSKLPAVYSSPIPYWPWIRQGGLLKPDPKTAPGCQTLPWSLSRYQCCISPVSSAHTSSQFAFCPYVLCTSAGPLKATTQQKQPP